MPPLATAQQPGHLGYGSRRSTRCLRSSARRSPECGRGGAYAGLRHADYAPDDLRPLRPSPPERPAGAARRARPADRGLRMQLYLNLILGRGQRRYPAGRPSQGRDPLLDLRPAVGRGVGGVTEKFRILGSGQIPLPALPRYKRLCPGSTCGRHNPMIVSRSGQIRQVVIRRRTDEICPLCRPGSRSSYLEAQHRRKAMKLGGLQQSAVLDRRASLRGALSVWAQSSSALDWLARPGDTCAAPASPDCPLLGRCASKCSQQGASCSMRTSWWVRLPAGRRLAELRMPGACDGVLDTCGRRRPAASPHRHCSTGTCGPARSSKVLRAPATTARLAGQAEQPDQPLAHRTAVRRAARRLQLGLAASRPGRVSTEDVDGCPRCRRRACAEGAGQADSRPGASACGILAR